jgi:RNA polymerase sigma-70 factor (ECF subfamily)
MDSDTVIRAQNGDRDAFTSLAEAIGGRFHAAAFSILRDRSLAEDATQQALLTVWRKLPQLRDPERFQAWSYRLLVNECYAQSKVEKRWISGSSSPGPAIEAMAVDEYGTVVDRDQLERAFRRLSIDHRTSVVLHHYLGMTVGQVAHATDAPVETVRSRLRYALRAMRSAIEADSRTAASGTASGETTVFAAEIDTRGGRR